MYKHEFTFQPINKKNVLIFLITIALYTGYYLGQRNVFILGEFLLLLLIAAFIYSQLLLRDILVKREHYPRTFEGSDVFTSLYFRTNNPVPHYLLEAVDTTPPAERYHIGHLLLGPFDKKNEYVIDYRMHCVKRRGVYTLGPLTLHCADPAGIFPRQLELPVFTTLLVYPQAANLQAFKLLGDGTLRRVGLETIPASGESEEFIGVREYVRGDPPGKIHWKLSAHHRKLIVKEFQENTITEVTMFLDLFRLSMSGLGEMTTIEYIIKTCAAITRAAIEKSHLVQVFAFGKNVLHIPTGGGMPHLFTILDRLTFLRASGEGSFTAAVAQQIDRLRQGSTAIFIACMSSIDPVEIVHLLRQLTIKRIRKIFVLMDDKSFIKLWQEQEIRQQQMLGRFEMLSILQNEGAETYIIECREKLEEKLISTK